MNKKQLEGRKVEITKSLTAIHLEAQAQPQGNLQNFQMGSEEATVPSPALRALNSLPS